MLHFDRLRVKNWVTWGQADVDLSREGVTFFRGDNRDANGNSNFSGKSSLMNALHAVTQSEHPQAQRKRSLSSVSRKDTRIIVDAHRDDGDTVSLDLHRGKTSILVGREDRRVAKKGAQREEVARIVGIPPELWACTVHVSGVSANPLLAGTGAARCSFLEQAFELDRWERKGVLIAARVATMKANRRELAEKEAELAAMGDEVDPAEMRREEVTLSAAIRKLEQSIAAASADLGKLDSLPQHPGKSAAHFGAIADRAEAKLREAEAAEAGAARAADLRAEWARYERERVRLEDEVRRYDNAPDVQSASNRHEECEYELSEARAFYDFEQPVREWRVAAKTIADRHGMRYASLRDMYAMSVGWVGSLRPGSSACPVCAGPFHGKVSAQDVDRLKSALARVPAGTDVQRQRPKKPLRYYEAAARESWLELEESRLADDASKALADLRAEKPDRPPEPRTDAPPASKVARILSAAREAQSRAAAWEKFGVRPQQAAHAPRLRATVAAAEKRLAESREVMTQLLVNLRVCEDSAARRKALVDRVAELRRELAVEPVYRALQLAYSPTGLRLDRLSEVLESLVSNLNSGSYALRDRVSYGYKLSRNRDLAITATNVHATYDVRFLSGAEQRVFALNLLMTLLPLLPTHRRASLLILDEMEANMSVTTRSVFSEEIVPKLQEIVPSTWIVTPLSRSAFNVPEARNLTAVKRDGVSTLQQS